MLRTNKNKSFECLSTCPLEKKNKKKYLEARVEFVDFWADILLLIDDELDAEWTHKSVCLPCACMCVCVCVCV